MSNRGYTSISIGMDTFEEFRDLRNQRGETTDELLKSLLNDAAEN